MSQDPWGQFSQPQPPAPAPQAAPNVAPQAPPQPYSPQSYAPQQNYQPQPQGYGQPAATSSKSPTAAGILALMLGSFGAHKFYLGYTTEGIIFLVVTLVNLPLFVFFWWLIVPFVVQLVVSTIALIEGIIYLTKTEPEFNQTYVYSRRLWF